MLQDSLGGLSMTKQYSDARFTVYGFMHKMGLSAAERLVYAMLYSYTRGECGMYFGSQAVCARILDLSPRTVARAYKKLLHLGYAVKAERGGVRGICCVLDEGGMPIICEEDGKSKLPELTKEANTESCSVGTKRDTAGAAISENSSAAVAKSAKEERGARTEVTDTENGSESPTPVLHNQPQRGEKKQHAPTHNSKNEPRYKLRAYGKERFVHLTEPQYNSLRRLVEGDVLEGYFLRMEKMLWEGRHSNIPAPHSHYRTLKKWIESDLSV